MPWHVSHDHAGCSGWAVIKDSDDTVVGCHPTEQEAKKHMAALYANEPAARAVERTYLVEDISIRAGSGGRTVVAYAAVFDTPAEIHDQDGHYYERIAPGAFDKTIREQLGHIQVFYNHGKTIYGTPSERFSVPLGVPEEVTPDGRGLLTVTRYNNSALAGEILDAIRNGDIKGQSFSGRFMPGASQRTRGAGGQLDTIVRSEISLREYGPTPMPSYHEAAIVGVRTEDLAETLKGLDDEQYEKLISILSTFRGTPLPIVGAAPTEGNTPPVNDPPGQEAHESPTETERRMWLHEYRRAC